MNGRNAPPPPKRTETAETYEYWTTETLLAPPNQPHPVPPPGTGWRLIAMAHGNGRLYRDWARKVSSNG